ncbi:hypothetical protein BASA81_001329 [Batrachochytrium salamandrivorans]|nr:hypothetical protein BASA81_001329 [Batrachochytrium salamandrivorans]
MEEGLFVLAALGVLAGLRARARCSAPPLPPSKPLLEIQTSLPRSFPLLSSPTAPASSSGTPKVFIGVGGHAKKNKGLPLLFLEDGYLLKPLQDQEEEASPTAAVGKRNRGQVEAAFYAKVWASDHPLKQVMPHFYGVEEMEDGLQYLCLEDLTFAMDMPCVLDLKMGRRSYADTASPEKVAKERAKYPPQEAVGFRFAGMRGYVSGELVESTREWCFSLQADDIPDALERFFFDGKQIRRNLIRSVVAQVQDIVHCLDRHATWRMYGASLLICYDAAAVATVGRDGGGGEDVVKCKLIDFANVYEIQDEGGKDYGFLHGLYFLLSALNIILDRGRRNLTRRGSIVDTTSRVIATQSLQVTTAATTTALLEADPHFLPVIQLKRKESVHSIPSPSTRSSPGMAPTKSSLGKVTSAVLEEDEEATSNSEGEEGGGEEGEEVNVVMDDRDLFDSQSTIVVDATATTAMTTAVDVFQVGGAHENIFIHNGSVCKQEVDSQSFESEAAFYESIANDALVRITPSFMGVEVHPETGKRAMLLEDISTLVCGEDNVGDERLGQINVMDVKLGFRSYKQDCSNEAKTSYFEKYLALANNNHVEGGKHWLNLPPNQRVLGKRDYLEFRDASTTSKECGFRLTALKHGEFSVSQDESKTVDSLVEFSKVMERFLYSTRGTFDSELCAGFIEELHTVLECFQDSEVFTKSDFVGTSLLFVHCNGVPVIRWIDFANVTSLKQENGEDGNGVVFGCRLIMQVLDTLLDQHHVGLAPVI